VRLVTTTCDRCQSSYIGVAAAPFEVRLVSHVRSSTGSTWAVDVCPGCWGELCGFLKLPAMHSARLALEEHERPTAPTDAPPQPYEERCIQCACLVLGWRDYNPAQGVYVCSKCAVTVS